MTRKKILVIEDNELNLRLFNDLLTIKGTQVIEVHDAFKAIETIYQEKPDLILMDIKLEGISGIDLIQIIKADPKILNIPIIAVTAFAVKEYEEKIMQSGCEAYISKPFTINHFFTTIDKFI